jgi:hypothetical protein
MRTQSGVCVFVAHDILAQIGFHMEFARAEVSTTESEKVSRACPTYIHKYSAHALK